MWPELCFRLASKIGTRKKKIEVCVKIVLFIRSIAKNRLVNKNTHTHMHININIEISSVRDIHNTVSVYGLCNTYVCIYVCTCRSDSRNNDNNTSVSWPTTTMISQCQNVVWKRTTLSRTTESTCKTRLVNPLSLSPSHPIRTWGKNELFYTRQTHVFHRGVAPLSFEFGSRRRHELF